MPLSTKPSNHLGQGTAVDPVEEALALLQLALALGQGRIVEIPLALTLGGEGAFLHQAGQVGLDGGLLQPVACRLERISGKVLGGPDHTACITCHSDSEMDTIGGSFR